MARVSRILVPMDGSFLSKQALKIALDEYPEAEIEVLHVINPTEPGYSYPIEFETDTEPLHGSHEWYERSEELAEELFDEAHEIAEPFDATVKTAIEIGDPGREIIDYVSHNNIDQIIIGSHGRDEGGPYILGSVTEAVAFRSPVRVLLVR